MIAKGEFEVGMNPQSDEAFAAGRMTLDKVYQGDLSGTGKGQMLSLQTEVKGSAGYVALEQVAGTLGGRAGGFTLQHSGTMKRGASTLSVTVVPDSGTGELAGLSGSMTIVMQEGQHLYEFDYTLDGA